MDCVVVVMRCEEDTGLGIREVLFRSAVSFHQWFSFTTATDAFSLSPATAFLRFGLCFHFKPGSLPVFCCWISSSSRYVFMLLSVSW